MKIYNVISLGAGVQSSTMALMAECGELPMPDFAIFADTQDEPDAVYTWLDWLEKQLSFPVYRTTKGKLSDAVTNLKIAKAGHSYTEVNIPVFTLTKEGKKGMTQRQCTSEFKVRQIRRELRKHITRKDKVIQWLGISTDEASRMKTSEVKYIQNIYPLIEKGVSRQECLSWMKDKGYPTPPRSACYYCPFHNDAEWRSLSTNDFQRAVEFEKRIQEVYEKADNLHSVPYLHQKRIPLDEVDFNKETNNMINECEGYCGI